MYSKTRTVHAITIHPKFKRPSQHFQHILCHSCCCAAAVVVHPRAKHGNMTDVREMGGASMNPAPRNHFLVWMVKPSGCHCTYGHLTSRASRRINKYRRVPTRLGTPPPSLKMGRTLSERIAGAGSNDKEHTIKHDIVIMCSTTPSVIQYYIMLQRIIPYRHIQSRAAFSVMILMHIYIYIYIHKHVRVGIYIYIYMFHTDNH